MLAFKKKYISPHNDNNIYYLKKKKKKKGKKRKPMKFFKKKIEKQKLSATGLVCGETIKPTRH